MSRRANSPKRAKDQKSVFSTLVGSGVAVLVVMLAMGQFPQVNKGFAELNEIIQQNNDEIVQAIVHALPAAAVVLGLLALSYMILSSVRARRKPASH